jgi:hypothetical protein
VVDHIDFSRSTYGKGEDDGVVGVADVDVGVGVGVDVGGWINQNRTPAE